MKPSSSRTALLITTAVATLGFATAATAQQPGAAGQPQMQSAAQGQSGFNQHIATLEQGRNQIQNAQPAQVGQLKQPLINALGDIEKDLKNMQGQQAQSAARSIDEAQQALEGAQADKGRIVQAIDNVLRDVRQLQTASASGSAGQSSGNARGAEIAVQQPSPQVSVQQPAPQVTVNQPPPQVTVQQPKPQVTVQQPQPKVTVDQGEPKVTVEKQGQPQVNVEKQRQAQVDVQSPANRASESNSGSGLRTGVGSGAGSSAEPAGTSASRNDAAQTGAAISLASANREQLVGKEIYGSNNQNIGEVEDVVVGPNARLESVLVDVGGFLGIGARRVAIPISQLQLQGDRLISNLTEEQARALPEHKSQQ